MDPVACKLDKNPHILNDINAISKVNSIPFFALNIDTVA